MLPSLKVHDAQTRDLVKYSRLVYMRGLVSAAGGNLSARCGEEFLITGTNIPLRRMKREEVVLCDKEGKPLAGREGLHPSKETPLHAKVYGLRPEIGFVIHAHPVHTIAFSLLGVDLPILTESARMKLGEIPAVEEALPGSQGLAELVADAVQAHPKACAFLMRAHGALVLAPTAEACFCLLELLEDTCKIALLARK